ncbi:MAG: D-glycero-beta-D-manno-heptose 1-phosphate adenylyltransferase [Candidatus Sericytochromatia bacterium]|nr:D-glycero-beta-D-manno-heptose 1-phosphate adenylyltransferase [Candidatus Sericytochromatia bacterium]
MGDIISREQAATLSQAAQAQGRSVVLTNGCFDILHVGHLRYLQQARAHGDLLIVGVNDDASVQRLKGPTRPLVTGDERAELLAGLACVDAVVIFPEATADPLLEAIRPSIYVKGADYNVGNLPERETVERLGVRPVFVALVAGRSTTNLVGKIQES